jgi:glycosyltransferase involved in cell wall biosynthesis
MSVNSAGYTLRIGLVAPPWLPVPPAAYGGTESIVDLLARGLCAAGHEVLLACRSDSTCPVDRVSPPPGADELMIGNTIEELRHTAVAYELLGDVDVIHDHTLLGPLVGRPANDTPVVVTHHGPFDQATLPLFQTISHRAGIVAISQSQASTSGNIPIHRVIHHGIEIDAFPVGPGDGGYVAYLGRMAPEKGADVAVQAAKAAGVPIILAAKATEPAERAFFEERVRPHLGPGAEYIGEADPAEKAALLGGATALVNPICWDEPFGLVMVESLATGTPVVAFPSGAAPEIVEHGVNGFLCADLDSMVAAIHDVASLDRATCRRIAVERFSAERMIDDHVAMYLETLANRQVTFSLQPPRGTQVPSKPTMAV